VSTYSGVFKIRVHPFNPWHPCAIVVVITGKTPQKAPTTPITNIPIITKRSGKPFLKRKLFIGILWEN